jgi:hypothetical protein
VVAAKIDAFDLRRVIWDVKISIRAKMTSLHTPGVTPSPRDIE